MPENYFAILQSKSKFCMFFLTMGQRSSRVAQEWCSRQHSDDAVRQASDLTIGAAGEGDVVFGRF